MKIFPGFAALTFALFTLACNRKEANVAPLFELQQNTGIDFVNKVERRNPSRIASCSETSTTAAA